MAGKQKSRLAEEGAPKLAASRAKLQVIHRHRMFRECLIAVLSRNGEFEVSEIVATEVEACFAEHRFIADIILVDAGLPARRGVELIHRIQQLQSHAKIIAVVSANAKEMAIECIAAGAHGCVLEESSLEDLRAGIAAVQEGETFCSQDLIQAVLTQFARLAQDSNLRRQVKSVELSPRELEILELISKHMGNKQIAKLLSVSLFTVKNHVHNILEKLNLESRFEAVDYARQRHWIKLADESLKNSRARSTVPRPR